MEDIMIFCNKPVGKSKTGVDRGNCNKSPNHIGKHRNNTCPHCGVLCTEQNVHPSYFLHSGSRCKNCANLSPAKLIGYKPRNVQILSALHVFPCGCEGVLPE